MLSSKESSIERACHRYAADAGYTLLKISSVKGWPDRLLLSSHGYHVFIEFKRPGAKPDNLQAYILEILNKERHGAIWINNVASFKNLLTYLSSLPPCGNPEFIKHVASNGC